VSPAIQDAFTFVAVTPCEQTLWRDGHGSSPRSGTTWRKCDKLLSGDAYFVDTWLGVLGIRSGVKEANVSGDK
jgi:hypothetical protein